MNPDDRSPQLNSHAPHGQPDGQLDAQQKNAQVARDQAHHQYRVSPPNQLHNELGAPYNQTHQPTYDWQQYHSAWQQYYQQYYQRYYAQELLSQREQDHRYQEEAKPEAPQLSWQTVTGSDHADENEPRTRAQQLRNDLLDKIRERTKKLHGSNHFVPIVCAVIVGLLFLALQFNRVFVAQIEAYISPGSTVDAGNTVVIDPSTNVSKEPRLVIPKINVDVPVAYTVNTVDEKAVEKALENGVVHYGLPGANSLPGQVGNGVILGYSSNDVFDPGNYKFVFLLLNRLQNGDLFYFDYQGKRFVYRVNDRKVINPSDWKVLRQNDGKPTMILVTCTPAGTALQRLLIYGEQISPNPTTASAAPVTIQDANPAEIPGNSKTFFERLYDLFF